MKDIWVIIPSFQTLNSRIQTDTFTLILYISLPKGSEFSINEIERTDINDRFKQDHRSGGVPIYFSENKGSNSWHPFQA